MDMGIVKGVEIRMCKWPPGDPINIKIALAGNPNCGKTTLFNALSAVLLHQRYGCPGVGKR